MERKRVLNFFENLLEIVKEIVQAILNKVMAKQIKELPERIIVKHNYPLEKWFDGNCWEIEKGKDFFCSLNGINGSLHRLAKQRGLQFTMRTISETKIAFTTSPIEVKQ